MPVVREVGASETWAMCLFSDPGVGKTRLIGSGAKDYKTLLLRSPGDKVNSILGSGAKEIVAADHEELLEALDMLRHVEKGEWDIVAWDAISIWQDFGLWDVLEGAFDRAGPPGSPARKHREQFYADKGEYHVNMQRISRAIRELSGSEAFNFVVTAHAFWGKRLKEDDTEDESGAEQLQPWIQGKGMVSKVCGMMDVVGYLDHKTMKIRGQNRNVIRLHTEGSEQIYAKNQFYASNESVFGPGGVMINPTMPKIVEAINSARPAKRTRPTRRPASRRPAGRRS